MSSHALIRVCLVVLISVLPTDVLGGSFKVVPVKLFLDAKTKTAVLTVTNNGDEKVTIQLDALEWGQDEKGEDRYGPTKDVIFFPKILNIEKGEEKIVRAGYQGQSPGIKERTYRLYLEELPVSTPGEVAVKMALRLGVPIFISPPKLVRGRAIEKVELLEGRVQVKIKNSGNSHFIVKGIKVTGLDNSEAEVFGKEIGGWYVLPGVSRTFSMEIPEEACQKSSVMKAAVKVEQTTLEARSAVDRSQCSHKSGDAKEPEKVPQR